MKNVFKPLAKSVLIPIGLVAAASATDTVIPKSIFGSGGCPLDLPNRTMLLISNGEMDDENRWISWRLCFFFIKGVKETVETNKKVYFLACYQLH